MQLALPCLLFSPGVSTLILKGGTHAEMAPPIDYITEVSTVKRLSALGSGRKFNIYYTNSVYY